MTPWLPSVRTYPHFDAIITPAEAQSIAMDPPRVSAHPFYPFLKYDEGWTAFAKAGKAGKRKDRPIRYAARLDSCIFSYYRHVLSEPYEKRLSDEGLAGAVIAYRRIPKVKGKGGQSNVEFALSSIETVRALGDCCTIALDISSFFETLDHGLLKSVWLDLIGKSRLPDDHFAVFEAITRYAHVDVKMAYERLGYFGEKKDRFGKVRPGFLRSRSEIPVQLCDGKTFRKQIAGDGPLKSLIQVNKSGMGVPQGAPLSDLLANMYLLEFDKFIQKRCSAIGGTYFRYSDDILIIAPIPRSDALALEIEVRNAIGTYGKTLTIREVKSAIHEFASVGDRQLVSVVKAFDKDEKPTVTKRFEYLGFRYDGKNVFIRDKTMSNLHRKIASVCRASAIRLVRRFQGKTAAEILDRANVEKLIQAFGTVEDFYLKSDDYRSWTFTTYAKRASKVMGALGGPINHQLRNLRQKITRRLVYELSRAKV